MYRRVVIGFHCCLFFTWNSIAQIYPFVSYTPKDGLIGNRVHFISQDKKGRLYFATSGGLSVYDGSRFTNYTTENGLAASLVNDVVELGDDSLLIVPNMSALHLMVKGKIRNVVTKDHFYPVTNQLIKCRDDHFYAVADEGLFRYEGNRFIKINLSALPGINAGLNLYHATEVNGFLFVNTDPHTPVYSSPSLFFAYNIHTGRIIYAKKLPSVYYSVKSPGNGIIVATSEGIFEVDTTCLRKGTLKLMPLSSIYKAAQKYTATFMYFDRHQALWLATTKGIMKIENGKNQLFSMLNGLPNNFCSYIFQDRENIMWFGNYETGVIKLVNEQIQLFSTLGSGFHISDISAHCDNDSVWFYDNQQNFLILHFNDHLKKFPLTGNISLDKICMGHYKFYGVNKSCIFELKFGSSKFSLSPLCCDSTNAKLRYLLLDNNENLIAIGSNIKVIYSGYNIQTLPLDHIADQASLTDNGLLYVTTRSKRIYIYKLHPSYPENYFELLQIFEKEVPNLGPRSMALDSSGELWIGTRNHGLYSFSIKNKMLTKKKQFTLNDGLTENFIQYISTDKVGNLWAGSPEGLDKITRLNDRVYIENITKSANLFINVLKVQSDRQGVVWVLTSSGLLKISPYKRAQLDFTPKIVFTKVTAANNQITLNNDMTLQYFQNNLSFQIAAPSFFDEKQTIFNYKLNREGSGQWIGPSHQADVNFINLPEGRYDLEVEVQFLNGHYSPLKAHFPFSILPPWWRTWWFHSLEIFIAVFIILLITRFYYRGRMKSQRILLEQKQAIEKERARIATDMHDDFGSGLSRIKVLSETIKFEHNKGMINVDHINKIGVYSEEMMDKMGEIVWALNEGNDFLMDLISYTRAYAVEYLTNNHICCDFEVPSNLEPITLSGAVRRNIFLSIKEALHNIIKHATASHVKIYFQVSDKLCIVIKDNGKGFQIDRFRQFGNGIKNIRKRMEEIGGEALFLNDNGAMVELRVLLSI